MWYRIELNKDRSVRTCVEVSGSLNEGRSVHYIEADSKEKAIAILAAAYDKRMAQSARRAQAHNQAKVARGECQCCGRTRDGSNATLCTYCLARKNTRRREIAAGAPLAVKRRITPVDRAEGEAIRRAKETARGRARKGTRDVIAERDKKVFVESLDAFETMTPSRFRGWLVAKIQECQDKIDGKKSIAEHFPQAAE